MKQKKKRGLMPSGAKRIAKVWSCLVIACLLVSMMALPCFAQETDPV